MTREGRLLIRKDLDSRKVAYNEKDNCFVSVDIEFACGSGL